MAHVRHAYSRLLRSVGTEFKAMQELLRHSTLRSNLDVYTQAVTPAKHAAQAAVVSLVFFEGAGGGSVIAEGATASLPTQELRHKQGAECAFFAPPMVSKESA
jgi:hypothetical protein